jgi:hypothetical protein
MSCDYSAEIGLIEADAAVWALVPYVPEVSFVETEPTAFLAKEFVEVGTASSADVFPQERQLQNGEKQANKSQAEPEIVVPSRGGDDLVQDGRRLDDYGCRNQPGSVVVVPEAFTDRHARSSYLRVDGAA